MASSRVKIAEHWVIDLRGHTYGELKVTGYSHMADSKSVWDCECSCGKKVKVKSNSLRTRHNISCGHVHQEQAKNLWKSLVTHGQARAGNNTRTYRLWIGMHERCKGNRPDAKNYSGRGIQVSDAWRSFDIFYSDMGECPEGMTLERKDNSLGYSKDNCRWASRKEQARNTRRTVFVLYDGKIEKLAELCERYSCKYYTVYRRMFSQGWPADRAINTPCRSAHENK